MAEANSPRRWIDVTWGTHKDFTDLYEFFLEAVYPPATGERPSSGRWRLAQSVGTEIRARGAATVLDCAAGTGFPALDMATNPSHGLFIHCTDADPAMLQVLARRAEHLGVPLAKLTPRRADTPAMTGPKSLELSWEALGTIRGGYDYVLCRGNSLAYADTWTGRDETTPLDRVADYLANMAAKVRPGGYLHVDAPWQIGLDQQGYVSGGTEGCSIWEQVTSERDCRSWDLSYKFSGGRTIKFRRFSSLLTIDIVQAMLDELGFEDTEPFPLMAERPNFGVIIARRGP